MAHAKFDENIDVTRRNIGNALLGALGSAVGLSVLSGCSAEGETTPNATLGDLGVARQGLVGTTPFQWVDTIANDLLTNSTLQSSGVVVAGGYWQIGDGGG